MSDTLKYGCFVDQDNDGDWLLVPPADVTIFSVPGEPVLLAASDEQRAHIEARDYLDRVSDVEIRK